VIDPGLLELLQQAAAGRHDAEQRAVAALAPAVRNIVRNVSRLQDWAAVEDMGQEILWELVQRLRANLIDDWSRVDHYIARMVRNMAADLWHERQRRSPAELDRLVGDDDPLAEVERSDALRAARLVIASMRVERDRSVLLGTYFEGRSKQEICRDLDIDTAHFDRVLHRARERLVALLHRGPAAREVEGA
jgi:RNA polymerase sigma-70 factor (ECF subfamily)